MSNVAALGNIADLPFASADSYGDRPAWRYLRGGVWVDRSYREVADEVRTLAAGLVAQGIAPGDRVCVLGETSERWAAAGLAVLAAGAILVPVYATSSPEECAWIVTNSGARLVLCDTAAQAARFTGVQTVVGLDSLHSNDLRGNDLRSDDGAEVDRRRAALRPNDPSVIIYTSGTTGPPKGCVLSHRNWLTLCAINEELDYIVHDDVVYLFLPLAHVFAQMVLYATAYAGATLAFFGGDPRQVVAELAQVRPTFLPSVPRVFEKVYTLFAGAPRSAELYAKVRGVFGGRLRMALSGAAPIAVGVLEFFHAAGVPVLEGYGMTESCGIGTVNTLARHRLGAVGVASPQVEVKLGEHGEILMRGPHLFQGYWRDLDATAAALADGWLHTGDLGTIDADGFVTITGRIKDIIITASGKNVAPANLENELRQSRWISHAVLYGDRQPYLVALLTLDAEEILPWAQGRGLPADVAELAEHPEVRTLLAEVVETANARHARAAQVKRFAILPRDLGQETGELTPTLKVKRRVVQANHADILEMLYQ
jgi:long-chain acyl-CoA synthetase